MRAESAYQYVWLLWSSAFLGPWALLYFGWPALRGEMIRVSAATSLLGLTEPMFVPEYWNPPSLFDLATRTGFDIESLVFCFAIGGIGAAMKNIVFYYRDYAYQGDIKLGSRTFKAVLVDDAATGDFRGKEPAREPEKEGEKTAAAAPKASGVNLLIDVNGNGQADAGTGKGTYEKTAGQGPNAISDKK